MFIEINPASIRERLTVQTARPITTAELMPGDGYLKFRNDRGVREICTGVKEFKCIGKSRRRTTHTSTSTWARQTRSSVPTAGRSSASILG